MNKLILMTGVATIFTLGTISESWAESWNCGPKKNGEYSNSVICTYDEESKTLIIEGEGNMGDYAYTEPVSEITPWTSKEIVHAVIKGNVTSIGNRVFRGVASLQDISGTENITSIGEASFAWTALSSADFPNVEYVKGAAFLGAKNLEYVNFEKDVTFGPVYAGFHIFGSTKIPDCDTTGKCCNGYIKRGAGCVKDCGENFRPNDGECDRLRYTPAEAAAILHDDNTNEVTITFKK